MMVVVVHWQEGMKEGKEVRKPGELVFDRELVQLDMMGRKKVAVLKTVGV
jgi:hypothetical protein